jgi:hypothetical protein
MGSLKKSRQNSSEREKAEGEFLQADRKIKSRFTRASIGRAGL